MDIQEEKLSRAISATSRRQILRLISDKELTVTDIVSATGMSKSLVSRHLTLLNDLGFLKVRKEFPYKYYSLKIKELKELLIVYDRVIKKL
jgi:DNA-binding transcriptional ArsR family regulator